MLSQIFLHLLFRTLNSTLKSELREAQVDIARAIPTPKSQQVKQALLLAPGMIKQTGLTSSLASYEKQTKPELNKAHLSAGTAFPFCSTRKQDEGGSMNLMTPFNAKC